MTDFERLLPTGPTWACGWPTNIHFWSHGYTLLHNLLLKGSLVVSSRSAAVSCCSTSIDKNPPKLFGTAPVFIRNAVANQATASNQWVAGSRSLFIFLFVCVTMSENQDVQKRICVLYMYHLELCIIVGTLCISVYHNIYMYKIVISWGTKNTSTLSTLGNTPSHPQGLRLVCHFSLTRKH